MRHLHQLCRGLSVVQLTHAVTRQTELWNRDVLRTRYFENATGVAADYSDIWLRFQRVSAEMEHNAKLAATVLDDLESINYPAFSALPAARAIVWDLMRLVEGERLGRVLITRLAPGHRIAAHVDGGLHASYYDRYHVMLQSLPGVVFRVGEESVGPASGEVWWFDNLVEHQVVNNSADDRLIMIVDIRTMRSS